MRNLQIHIIKKKKNWTEYVAAKRLCRRATIVIVVCCTINERFSRLYALLGNAESRVCQSNSRLFRDVNIATSFGTTYKQLEMLTKAEFKDFVWREGKKLEFVSVRRMNCCWLWLWRKIDIILSACLETDGIFRFLHNPPGKCNAFLNGSHFSSGCCFYCNYYLTAWIGKRHNSQQLSCNRCMAFRI